MKALVAYYSLSGTTEKAAKELSGFLESKGHKATVEKIIPKKGYSKLSAYLIGCMQAMRKHTVELNPSNVNPADFGLIAVLSPTWAFTCAPPAYSFASSLPEARKGQKAIAITANDGTPGDGPKALAGVLGKKGYEVVASFTVSPKESLREIFEKEIRL